MKPLGRHGRLAIGMMGVFFLTVLGPSTAHALGMELLTLQYDGVQPAGDSWVNDVSADGRYVVISSSADTLVAGDTNGTSDVFVFDRELGRMERVSVNDDGIEGNSYSYHQVTGRESAISDDGRFVVFMSNATNLVPNDTNGFNDVFVRDRELGVTRRVNLSHTGAQVYAWTQLPSISGNGRYVVFDSRATDIVPDDTNDSQDVFIHDMLSGVNERISVGSGGQQTSDHSYLAVISADGNRVAFASAAMELPGAATGRVTIYLRDRLAGTTSVVSIGNDGALANAHASPVGMSADGNFISFITDATNLWDGTLGAANNLYLKDMRPGGRLELLNVSAGGAPADGESTGGAISSDGRWVTFASIATNLVPEGDVNDLWDVYLRDRETGSNARITVAMDGSPMGGGGNSPVISGDGSVIAFRSVSPLLVPGDTKGSGDVFAYEWQATPPNTPPVADAGSDLWVGAGSPDGAAVALNGGASFDPDGDAIRFDWSGAFGSMSGISPVLSLPIGNHVIRLAVTDVHGAEATDQVIVSVFDGPPVVTPPEDVVVYSTGWFTRVDLKEAYALDAVDGILPAVADFRGRFPVGVTVVTWLATDSAGNTGIARQRVTVVARGKGLLTAPGGDIAVQKVPRKEKRGDAARRTKVERRERRKAK
ncbi:MAG: hypothetical protein ACE5FN_06670 [Leptospirillia bacterium]